MRDHRYHGHHSLVQAHGAFSRLSSGHRGFGRLGHARVFWLVGILLCSLLCLFLPQSMKRSDAILQYVLPLIGAAGAMMFALSFHQDFFDRACCSGGHYRFRLRLLLAYLAVRAHADLLPRTALHGVGLRCSLPLRQITLAVLDARCPTKPKCCLPCASRHRHADAGRNAPHRRFRR